MSRRASGSTLRLWKTSVIVRVWRLGSKLALGLVGNINKSKTAAGRVYSNLRLVTVGAA
jgi:hypothetical protein